MEQWEVARCGGVCAATGRTLAEDEAYYAVLFEDGETFRREDYSLDGWQGPPVEAYCYFKTRVPVREKKKRLLVDDDVLLNFFLRLGEEEQESRLHFRFVLALILMRKRILKYEDTTRADGKEHWHMRQVKEQTVHRVYNPQLNDTQIEAVSRELGAILHGDMGEFDDLADGDSSGRDSSDDGLTSDGLTSAEANTEKPVQERSDVQES